jgi:hypothetical protein
MILRNDVIIKRITIKLWHQRPQGYPRSLLKKGDQRLFEQCDPTMILAKLLQQRAQKMALVHIVETCVEKN